MPAFVVFTIMALMLPAMVVPLAPEMVMAMLRGLIEERFLLGIERVVERLQRRLGSLKLRQAGGKEFLPARLAFNRREVSVLSVLMLQTGRASLFGGIELNLPPFVSRRPLLIGQGELCLEIGETRRFSGITFGAHFLMPSTLPIPLRGLLSQGERTPNKRKHKRAGHPLLSHDFLPS
jgi:hypothetical protein